MSSLQDDTIQTSSAQETSSMHEQQTSVSTLPSREQRQSARTTLTAEQLIELAANDPSRQQRSFEFKYKEMKLKPRLLVLEGTKNYPQWSRRVESLMDSIGIKMVVVEGVIPFPDATEAELDFFSRMQ